jgi:hypothetical protein
MKSKLMLAGLLAGTLMLGAACTSDTGAVREETTDPAATPGTGGAGDTTGVDEDRPIDPSAGRLQGQGIGAPESDIMRERVEGGEQMQQDDTSTLGDEQNANDGEDLLPKD